MDTLAGKPCESCDDNQFSKPMTVFRVELTLLQLSHEPEQEITTFKNIYFYFEFPPGGRKYSSLLEVFRF